MLQKGSPQQIHSPTGYPPELRRSQGTVPPPQTESSSPPPSKDPGGSALPGSHQSQVAQTPLPQSLFMIAPLLPQPLPNSLQPAPGSSRAAPLPLDSLLTASDPLSLIYRGLWIKGINGEVTQINGGIDLAKNPHAPPMSDAQKVKSFGHLLESVAGKKLPVDLHTQVRNVTQLEFRGAEASQFATSHNGQTTPAGTKVGHRGNGTVALQIDLLKIIEGGSFQDGIRSYDSRRGAKAEIIINGEKLPLQRVVSAGSLHSPEGSRELLQRLQRPSGFTDEGVPFYNMPPGYRLVDFAGTREAAAIGYGVGKMDRMILTLPEGRSISLRTPRPPQETIANMQQWLREQPSLLATLRQQDSNTALESVDE